MCSSQPPNVWNYFLPLISMKVKLFDKIKMKVWPTCAFWKNSISVKKGQTLDVKIVKYKTRQLFFIDVNPKSPVTQALVRLKHYALNIVTNVELREKISFINKCSHTTNIFYYFIPVIFPKFDNFFPLNANTNYL